MLHFSPLVHNSISNCLINYAQKTEVKFEMDNINLRQIIHDDDDDGKTVAFYSST